MKQPVRIRTAALKDVPVIAAFNKAMALETEGKKLSAAVLARGALGLISKPEYGFYLVAEVKGKIVGSLMVTYEWSDWRNGVFWWIQSVYVAPEYRRKGVFSALFEKVRSMVKKDRSICGYRLYVDGGNHQAITTYKSLGMDETRYKLFENDFVPE